MSTPPLGKIKRAGKSLPEDASEFEFFENRRPESSRRKGNAEIADERINGPDGKNRLHSKIYDKNEHDAADIADRFLFGGDIVDFEIDEFRFNECADGYAESKTEAFPKAVIRAEDKSERQESKGADEEHDRFVPCVSAVEKPENKRKSEADDISADDVNGPVNPEIKS